MRLKTQKKVINRSPQNSVAFRIERFNKDKKRYFIKSLLLISYSMRQLILANAHLGYEVNRWNPENKALLWGSRSNMHILNLQETTSMLRRVFAFVSVAVKLRKLLLFASENKHIDHVLKKVILVDGQTMASNRWIGGIITNYKQIRNNVRNLSTRYTSKMKYKLLSNRRKKLKVCLEGLLHFNQLPALVVVLNGVKSKWAINEVQSKNIPCAAIIDSTASTKVTFPIPGNVYGFATQLLYVKLFMSLIRNARLKEVLTFIEAKNMSTVLQTMLSVAQNDRMARPKNTQVSFKNKTLLLMARIRKMQLRRSSLSKPISKRSAGLH